MHQTCFFRTHGGKITITAGTFKIILECSDQHVPGTSTVPVQHAPGVAGQGGEPLDGPGSINGGLLALATQLGEHAVPDLDRPLRCHLEAYQKVVLKK